MTFARFIGGVFSACCVVALSVGIGNALIRGAEMTGVHLGLVVGVLLLLAGWIAARR